VVEVELGQCFRSFPRMDEEEVDQLRLALDAHGARVSIVGLGLDDYTSLVHHRTGAERLSFLEPQLRAAHRLGAHGVRLPFGQPDHALLDALAPRLDALDLVLYLEIQGPQGPGSPGYEETMATLADGSNRRLKLLLDASMVTPMLPTSYLDCLGRSGVSASLVDRVTHEWGEPATTKAVRDCLAEDHVPPHAMALYMTMVVRFGTWAVADLEPLLPYTGAAHLKFWDLDDADGRVTHPLHQLGTALDRHGFTGTLCSEWGGHDWYEGRESATEMTRRHLELVRSTLEPLRQQPVPDERTP
jgi:hypothetical protein